MNRYHIKRLNEHNNANHEYGNKLVISNWPWEKAIAPNVPKVSARLAYNNACLFISFKVEENFTCAKCLKDQGEVHLDSCVEFFVAPNNKGYFNFEINCIGTIHLQYKKNRYEGIPVANEDIAEIQISTSLQKGKPILAPLKNQRYEVSFIVPLKLFEKYAACPTPTKETLWKGNFYKCGDETPEPSWGAWNNIDTPEPDFHCPEYFGELIFD